MNPGLTIAYVRGLGASMTGVELLCEDRRSITIARERCRRTGGVRYTLSIPKVLSIQKAKEKTT